MMNSKVINNSNKSNISKSHIFSLFTLLLVGITFAVTSSFVFSEDDKALSYYARAEQEKSQARLKKAEQLYFRALHHNPQLRAVYPALVDIYLSQHRIDAGLDIVDKGLSLFPGDEGLWVRKGLLLSKAHRFAESKVAYDRAESLAPDNPHIIRRVSGFYRTQGNVEKAESLDLRRNQLESITERKRPIPPSAQKP